MTERLEWARRSGKNLSNGQAILRRLSREEWSQIKLTNTIPYPGAVAVLVVPPPNKDRATKERPKPSMSMLPPADLDQRDGLPPISELLPTCPDSLEDTGGVLPSSKVPLYHSITAFPSRSQRAALFDFLTRILSAERHLKKLHAYRKKNPGDIGNEQAGKASHAFLLCSDAKTIRRGDSAAIAAALWRLKMYESEVWDLN